MILKGYAGSIDGGLGYNEDAYYLDEERGIYLLSDGMGGPEKGPNASQQACFLISDFLESTTESAEHTWPYEMLPHLSRGQNLIRVSVLLANEKIYEENLEKYSKPARASQIIALQLKGRTISAVNVGLNRAYLLRENSLQRIVHEVSLARQQHIVPISRQNNSALCALGLEESIHNMSFYEATLKEGDMILMISAGVYLSLDDEKIQKIVSSNLPSPQRNCSEILSFVQSRSPKHNATVVVLSAQEENLEDVFSEAA
ncbi:MAG: hypothetical protein HYS98_04615 [Deltaproteobacteria bacterium]|nr:hypothetical protein [Deltaproteobacteria bacterium]